MIYKTKCLIYLTIIIGTFAQDYDEIEDRRLHKRRRPQYGGGGGPCGRDVDGRFLSLQYVNVNYHVNCGGGGLHSYPQQDFLGGGGGLGGGHRPQKPHRPHKPLFGGGGGGHGSGGLLGGSHGNGGGLLGSHGGGGGGGLLGSHGGGILGSHGNGGGLGGIFQGNRPQSIVQDAVSGISNAISRPPFNQGGGNGGGILGLGLFDGSIINSFSSLFSNSNSNRPSQNDNTVQYVQDTINTNTDTNNNNNDNSNTSSDNSNTSLDEKPVHEDHDEIPEVYMNKLRRGDYVAGSPGYGGYYNPGLSFGAGGGYGSFNYNKAIKKVNRQINTALKPIYQLFRK